MKYNVENKATLIDLLADLYPDCSKTTLRSWVKEGRISLDGEIIKRTDHQAYKGQEIVVGAKPRIAQGDIRILYDDPHLVVIEKPEGLLSVATNFEKGDNAHAFLKNYYRPKRVYVVHRLDQDTSGVMLFALNEKGKDRLKEMFEKHDMHREYIAIVEGRPKESEGSWQCYLYEDGNYFVRPTDDPNKGRLAITHYQVLATKKGYSRLKLTLQTGRKNQIRVHCQMSGHPVVGDKKYGAKSNPLKRLCLHASTLSFKHPILKKMMNFTSKPPELFEKLI